MKKVFVCMILMSIMCFLLGIKDKKTNFLIIPEKVYNGNIYQITNKSWKISRNSKMKSSKSRNETRKLRLTRLGRRVCRARFSSESWHTVWSSYFSLSPICRNPSSMRLFQPLDSSCQPSLFRFLRVSGWSIFIRNRALVKENLTF